MESKSLALSLEERTIYWLGGSPCAGKSSVASALAQEFAWESYNCDAAYTRHVQLADPVLNPTLYHIGHLQNDALWMRPVAEQTRTEIQMYREEWSFIAADLRALATDRPLIVEGASLLPEIIAPRLNTRQHGIWLVPTPTFQHHHYRQRGWPLEVVADCRNPEAAFLNWMARDIGFAAYIAQTAQHYQVPIYIVDGAQSLAASIRWAKHAFGLLLSAEDAE